MSLISFQWKYIFYIQIVYYFLVIGGGVSLFLRLLKFSRNHGGPFVFKKLIIYLAVIPSVKIAGGVCGLIVINKIDKLEDVSTGLVICAVLFNSICVGFMLLMPLTYLRYIDHTDTWYVSQKDFNQEYYKGYEEDKLNEIQETTTDNSKYSFSILEKKMEIFVMIANFLTIGGSLSEKATSTSKSILIAGSFLYLASFLIVSALSLAKLAVFKQTHNDIDYRFSVGKILKFLLIIFPFLLARIVFSICSSLSFKGYDLIDIETPPKFEVLFGDWKIYLVLAFIEECILVLGLIFLGHQIDPYA